MVRFKIIVFSLGLLLSTNLSGQEYFDIKNPGKDYYKKCDDCINLLNNKPAEIQFGIQRNLSNELYFVVTHKEWFDELIKKGSDGIAVDIVKKDRYSCDKEKLNKGSVIRGDLQKPIYLKELKEMMLPSTNGEVIIKLGKVPTKFLNEEVEFNIVFIKNKYLCYYNNFFDLNTYRWDLLEMGMYLDTLTLKSNYDRSVSEQEKYILSHKILRFEIPFEKNKSIYSATDIQPLYDSLRLTDYNIRKIKVKAYSSVEGNTNRNIELQNERANSIVNALQEFQESAIVNEISVSENWVEFLNDIVISDYSYFSDLTKDEIKQNLENKNIAKGLEPYLKNHRKAVVILELQKKSKFGEISTDGLMELFQKSITEKNLEQAIEIQNSIFDKVRNQEIPASYVDKLEIPKRSEFGILRSKNTVFKYLINKTDVYESLLELQKLEDLLPKDGHI